MSKADFENYISDTLNSKAQTDSVDMLNKAINETITDADKKIYCPKNKKRQNISPETRLKLEERRKLKSKNVNHT